MSLRVLALAGIASTLLAARAQSQTGTMTGTVLMTGTASALSDVMVRVRGTTRAVLTDSSGVFRFAAMPQGQYELEARRLGFADALQEVLVRADDTVRVTIVMVPGSTELVGIRVIGAPADAMTRFAGSVAVRAAAELAAIRPLSANDVLRTVPGVHVQEEEGLGLRANIGVRGLDPDRSRTLLVLEDGVPVALAPYGEPELYYSPPIERMDRLEVIKGSGSILFGPQTVGGVINYVTAAVPATPGGTFDYEGGTGGTRRARLRYGGTWGNARAGITAFHRGVRDLHGAFARLGDVTTKLGMRAGAQDLGLKLSVYDEVSNATYVGLTDSMYRADARQHPSPDDRLWVRRYALTASHDVLFGSAMLRTTAYAYTTSRDWMRRDYTYNATRNAHVFRATTGNRNRAFEVAGLEPRLRWSGRWGSLPQEIELGARAHREEARDQHVNGDTPTSRTGVVRDDEIRTGRAAAGFYQHRVWLAPSLAVSGGARVERFDFDRRVIRTRVRRTDGTTSTRLPEDVDIRSGDAVSELVPGAGLTWTPSTRLTLFAGVHRGFAPPRTKDALIYEDPTLAPGDQVPAPVSLELDAERSWNAEAGARVNPWPFMTAELTAFRLDFSNQIIEPSLSAGSVSQAQLANQGSTLHTGVEMAAGVDFAKMLGQPFVARIDGALTLVRATFTDHRRLATPDGDTADVHGNDLPYAPRRRAHVAATFEHPAGLTARFDASFVGDQFGDNFETVAGSADGRTGLIPAHRILNASARWRLPRVHAMALTASVRNLTGATYIASRRPEGIKPGLPRLWMVGAEAAF